ncbi:MAG TPA: hypothetical protein VGB02_04920 [Pyrinomonadaceae bacterium]|jgi:hypothetical protein
MVKAIILALFVFTFSILELRGQTYPREYWKEIADKSKTVIVGTVEKSYLVIRPEKYKPNPDGSNRSPREFIVGEIYRVKLSKKLKGKVKREKDGRDEYVHVFLLGGGLGIPGIGDPVLIPEHEYVLFLEPSSCNEELKGKEIIEYRPQSVIIRKPFSCELSYSVVDGFRGAVKIKADRETLIKEIKKSF